MIRDTLLALLAFGVPQSYMARLAICVPIMHDEAYAITHEDTIARDAQLATASRRGRIKERIATLGAEEVLFVIGPFAKVGVVETDEAFLNYSRFAMVALRSKHLKYSSLDIVDAETEGYKPHDNTDDNKESLRVHKN
jgi:hypothetical protein